MPVVVLLVRLVLGAVFGVAALTKLKDRAASSGAIAAFGLPPALARPIGLLLPLAELTVALLLVVPQSGLWGGVGALALLAIFTAAIGVNLARGRTPDCHCFGQLHSAPIGRSTLVRNGLFAAGAALVVWHEVQGGGTGVGQAVGTLLRSPLATGLLLGLAVLGLAAQGWLILHLFRQQGRLLLRFDGLEAALKDSGFIAAEVQQPQAGLPIGASAPDFELPSLAGAPVSLEGMRGEGNPVVLVFSDPGCSPCMALLPDLARWQREHDGELTFALVSRGTEVANIDKTPAHGLRHVLLQRDREVAEMYGAAGTPSAVLIRADGSIGSSVAMGATAIAQLVAEAGSRGSEVIAYPLSTNGGRRAPPAPAPRPGHVSLGSAAPSFRLHDLDGTPVESTELRGQNTLVLFWNPSCGFCERMLPDLKAWERGRGSETPQLIVISSGTVEANRSMGIRSPILLDQTFSVGRTFGAAGTPSAIMIDPDGNVASAVAVGADQVLALAGSEVAGPVVLNGAGTIP